MIHKHKPKSDESAIDPPGFKLGDKVKLTNGRMGEIVEIVGDHHSVKCAADPKSDHAHDTFGCVKAEDLTAA